MASFFVVAANSYAQTTTTDSLVDIIYLKDGSRLVGKITAYKRGDKATIEMPISAQPIEVAAAQIERVALGVSVQEKPSVSMPTANAPTVRQSRPRLLNQQGWYSMIEMPIIFRNPNNDVTNSGFNGSQTGIGFSYTFGYQKSPYYSFGGGLGYYSADQNNYVPIYIETQGYFQKHSFTPFYSFRLGYGILNGGRNFSNSVNMAHSHGGLYARPAVGFRYASRNRTHFMMSLGYHFQKAYVERVWDNWQTGSFVTRDNIAVSRLSLNFGLLLSHK
jgi:hypothetical protein